MTPDEGSAESGGDQSPAATSVRRPAGRGRYPRGRRRPRRAGTNQPRRLPVSSDAAGAEPKIAAESARPPVSAPLTPPFQPAKVESIQAAIDKVTTIIGELRDALNDMELVLEYLEDAERQQIADEREIETLHQRLNSMHRRPERERERYQPPQRTPPPRAAEDSAQDTE